MADNQAGLPALDPQDEVIKETRPQVKGTPVGGLKNVSLEPEQSSDIRDRLMQLIKEREAASQGVAPFIERLAIAAAPEAPAGGSKWAAYNELQNKRRQELLDMYTQVAGIDTEQKRLALARQQASDQKQQFGGLLGMGGAGAAQTNEMAQSAGVSPAAVNALDPNTKAQLWSLYQVDPKGAIGKLIELTKPTDLQRNASAVFPTGTQQWQDVLLSNLAGTAGEMIEVPDPNNPGFSMRVPKLSANRMAFTPAAPAPAGGALPTAVPASTPAPTGGALPTAAPAPMPAPRATAPAPMPAPRAAAPSLSSMATPNPYPKSDPRWAKFEEEKSKTQLGLEQKAAEVPIAGKAEETKKLAEEYAAQQKTHMETVAEAPGNARTSAQLIQDIKTIPNLIGKLNQPSFGSAFANALSSGVQLGQFGSLSVPVVKDLVVQLDPEVRRDPKKMEAYQRIINSMSRIGLQFARSVNKGMGSMSNYERDIVNQAIGDPSKMSANNLMMMAKAVELDAKNAQEQDRLWKQMEAAGRDWKAFRDSPELQDMKRKQFYRTANAMGLREAKFPGDR